MEWTFAFFFSDDSSDFEKSFEVIDLSEGHGDEDEGLEEGPHDDSGVRVLVDGAVDAVAHGHVLLLVFHTLKITKFTVLSWKMNGMLLGTIFFKIALIPRKKLEYLIEI